jgi:phosphoribosylcarboxyaminoimidazole (NCAIR) mutase
MAIEILSLSDSKLLEKYELFRKKLHDEVVMTDEKLVKSGWQGYGE